MAFPVIICCSLKAVVLFFQDYFHHVFSTTGSITTTGHHNPDSQNEKQPCNNKVSKMCVDKRRCFQAAAVSFVCLIVCEAKYC